MTTSAILPNNTTTLRDIRAELEEQLFTDLDPAEYPGCEYYRRLPAPNPLFDGVYVTNVRGQGPEHEWHVYIDGTDIEDSDVEEVEQLIGALQAATRQARILNMAGRVYEVEDGIFGARPDVGDRVYLFTQEGRVRSETVAEMGNLAGKNPGHQWGGSDDPEYRCTLLGTFEVMETLWVQGRRRLIVSDLPTSVEGIDL